jgi:hypothetical protein
MGLMVLMGLIRNKYVYRRTESAATKEAERSFVASKAYSDLGESFAVRERVSAAA